MRFLVDESADARLVEALRALGHDAVFIVHSHGPGLSDTEILAIAHAEQRILITDDRDFGDLVFNQGQPHSGVLYFRLATTDLPTKIERLTYALANHAEQLDRFVVVTLRRVRVRPAAINS